MNRKIAAALLTPVLFVAAPSFGASAVSEADKTFVEHAAQTGMAEVELGKLAQENGSSPAVKNFGERLVADHTKANDKLKQIAADKDIPVPEEISAEQRKHCDMLKNLSGSEFDKKFAAHMADGHKKAVGEFNQQAASGQDEDLKQFAKDTVPTLREHLRIAESLKNQIH